MRLNLACPTATLCVGADINGYAVVWRKGHWTRVSLDASTEFRSIACGSADFCMAGESDGNVRTWNGTRWSASHPTPASRFNPLSTIACWGSHICVAGTVYGAAEVWRNGGWSASQGLATNNITMVGAACFAGSTCLMVDGYGEVFSWKNGRWTKAAAVDPSGNPGILPNGATGLSCASPSFCAATNSNDSGSFVYFRAAVPRISTGSLPVGTVGRTYKTQLHARFGLGPYQWRLKKGGLPKGLKLGAKGVIKGKPAKAGTFKITLAASDPLGQTGTRKLTLTVKK